MTDFLVIEKLPGFEIKRSVEFTFEVSFKICINKLSEFNWKVVCPDVKFIDILEKSSAVNRSFVTSEFPIPKGKNFQSLEVHNQINDELS